MPFISICLRQGTKPCHERYVRTLGGVRRILRLRERLPKTSRDKNPHNRLTGPHAPVARQLWQPRQRSVSRGTAPRSGGHPGVCEGTRRPARACAGPRQRPGQARRESDCVSNVLVNGRVPRAPGMRLPKSLEAFIKGFQRPFAAYGRAEEHHDKIDYFVPPDCGDGQSAPVLRWPQAPAFRWRW